MLGLDESAVHRFEANLADNPRDIYSDRSRIELAKVLASGADDEDLLAAAHLLRGTLADAVRYDEDALVRIEALFLLGGVDVRLAGRYATREPDVSPKQRVVLEEALEVLEEALAYRPEEYPSTGSKARPLFAELIAARRAEAHLDRGEALHRLGRHAEASASFKTALDEGAGPVAALYESLAICLGGSADGDVRTARDRAGRFAASGEEAWAFTCAAIEKLQAGDEIDARILAERAGRVKAGGWPAPGMLSPRYWQRWSRWIAARAGEGIVDDGSN
jgi:tetratricopeptide (TPR) repeat protein